MLHPAIKTFKDTWKVSTTFMGTIVGAGFASGQEILKFFSHSGANGITGIIIACLLFCLTGTLVMVLGSRLNAVSFSQVVRHVCGKFLGPYMDTLLSLFLFATLSVMLAGSGAVFFQQWAMPYWFGTGITLVITILTVLFGLKGIINANAVVVPIMVTLCILATIPSISPEKLRTTLSAFTPVANGASSHWLLSTLLYVSYNITLGVSVLAPLGNEIKNKRPLILGGILGGLGLGFMAMIINLAILSHYPLSAQYEIPSLFLAGRFAIVLQFAFSLVLWAEIFTTIIGNVYGLAVRLSEISPISYITATVILMVFALAMSQIGFSGLVGTLYPAFGYISLLFLALLLILPFRRIR